MLASLSAAVRAQVAPQHLRFPLKPTREAARQWEADQPRLTDMVLVKLRPGIKTTPVQFAAKFSASAATLNMRNAARAAKHARDVPPALTYLRSHNAIGWHSYRLPSTESVAETLEALRQHPDVLQATMVQRLRLLNTPPTNPQWGQVAEPYLFSLFLMSPYGGGLTFDGQPRDYDSSAWTYSWVAETINAVEGWNYAPPGYPFPAYPTAQHRLLMTHLQLPIVAILDTGLDMNHPAFGYAGTNSTDVSQGGHILKKLARSFFNGNRDNDPRKAMDVFGHGTSVAGLIGAAPNNGLGVPGVGFTSRLLPIRVYNEQGSGLDSDLYDAIAYAADSGALIINISARTDVGFSPAAQDAIDYAWSKGSLVVAAFGNDGKSTNDEPTFRRYPASLHKVLSVGASVWGGPPVPGGYIAPSDNQFYAYTGPLSGTEDRASYSNYGRNLGVVAPAGDGIAFANHAPLAESDELWNTMMLLFQLNLGIPPGSVPELMFAYTTSPTYTVPMNDATNSPFGSYSQLGFYGLNYGSLPGTSFAAPSVAGLAALYAAKYSLPQAPGTPQTLIRAIERGCDNVHNHPRGGIADFGLLAYYHGYGRINAGATLRNLNQRNATVGGLVGVVKDGLEAKGGAEVTATRRGDPITYRATTFNDGVFHLVNLPAEESGTSYNLEVIVGGQRIRQTVNVFPGYDTHGVELVRGPVVDVRVSPFNPLIPFGTTFQFSATVFNTTNTGVTWHLFDAPGASINANGLLTAPNGPGANFALATVRATSVQDPDAWKETPITFVPRLTGLTINPGTVGNGGTATGRITLSHAAPAGGAIITVLSNSTLATVPLTVTVPAGQTDVNFTITASATGSGMVTITACYATLVQTATLQVGAATAVIAGQVELSGISALAPVQDILVHFRTPGTTNTLFSRTVSILQPTGAFSIPNVPRGNYTLAFKGAKWLRTVRTNVNASSGNVSGVNVVLRPGDLNNDNIIDLFDLITLFENYGLTSEDPEWDGVADLNCDGFMDLFDLILLFENYGTAGDP
jgi:hypothetical protein